jgi:hypothetical protein
MGVFIPGCELLGLSYLRALMVTDQFPSKIVSAIAFCATNNKPVETRHRWVNFAIFTNAPQVFGGGIRQNDLSLRWRACPERSAMGPLHQPCRAKRRCTSGGKSGQVEGDLERVALLDIFFTIIENA